MKPIRSRNNKNKKPAVKTIETAVKGTVKVTTITAVSAALLVYPGSARYTGAYFTSSKTSEDPLVLTIKSLVPEVSAVVKYELDQAAMPEPKFSLMGAGLAEGMQGIQDGDVRGNGHPRLNSVVARIRLPEDSGFFVEDIIIRTIELRYDSSTAEVIVETARIEGDALIVEFDGNTVERWLEDVEPGCGSEFIVTGEGIRAEDGMRFTFSADDIVEIIDEVVAEIDRIRIYGPGEIEIPLEGESIYKYSFRVLDTEGGEVEVEGEEVTWSVEGSGVAIDQNGELTVTSDAAPGTITITAVLSSDENIQGTLRVELTAVEEELPEEEVPAEEEPPAEELPPPKDETQEGESGEAGDGGSGEGGDHNGGGDDQGSDDGGQDDGDESDDEDENDDSDDEADGDDEADDEDDGDDGQSGGDDGDDSRNGSDGEGDPGEGGETPPGDNTVGTEPGID